MIHHDHGWGLATLDQQPAALIDAEVVGPLKTIAAAFGQPRRCPTTQGGEDGGIIDGLELAKPADGPFTVAMSQRIDLGADHPERPARPARDEGTRLGVLEKGMLYRPLRPAVHAKGLDPLRIIALAAPRHGKERLPVGAGFDAVDDEGFWIHMLPLLLKGYSPAGYFKLAARSRSRRRSMKIAESRQKWAAKQRVFIRPSSSYNRGLMLAYNKNPSRDATTSQGYKNFHAASYVD